MTELTQKYRLIYNPATKLIRNSYDKPYNSESRTYLPAHLAGYEAATLAEIEQFIADNDLQKPKLRNDSQI